MNKFNFKLNKEKNFTLNKKLLDCILILKKSLQNSWYKNNISPKKLLIIGNGFDLHQQLASSFNDFFNSKDYFEKYIDSRADLSDAFWYISSISNGNEQDISPKEYIKRYTESYFLFSKYNNSQYKIRINKQTNFWVMYFKALKSFPQFSNGNSTFEFKETNRDLKNWADIEFQMAYMLHNTQKVLDKFSNCAQYNIIGYLENKDEFIRNLLESYESSYLLNNKFTFNSVISFITIRLSLATGWNPKEKNIYDYLYEQLQKFEEMFGKYLKTKLDDAKENNNYTGLSNSFANKLADNQNYSLLNFNYTTFYNVSDPNKTNIHSTLEEGGHPIFGISSDLGNNELIYQKPYYRFSKAYRIMKLTNDNSIKNILPKNIDEIIFYGQSLSQADYLYFDTIFSEYKIYDNDSNIKLTFKYSNFDATANIEQQQINIVYKLINQFSNHINMYNLLTKLLLENRLNIEEVPEDSKKTSTD